MQMKSDLSGHFAKGVNALPVLFVTVTLKLGPDSTRLGTIPGTICAIIPSTIPGNI